MDGYINIDAISINCPMTEISTRYYNQTNCRAGAGITNNHTGIKCTHHVLLLANISYSGEILVLGI